MGDCCSGCCILLGFTVLVGKLFTLSPFFPRKEAVKKSIHTQKKNHTLTGWARNPRGQGYVFGTEAVDEFLQMNNITMIVRAHQCVDKGIEFFGPGQTFLTVFSAPHYANGTNTGAILRLDETGDLSFEYFPETKAPKVALERPSPSLPSEVAAT